MDPVSHAAIGRMVTLAAGRAERLPRGATAAAVLGALSPDVDFLLMPAGWDIYLRAHGALTHSLTGALVTGLGAAVLIRVLVRRTLWRQLIPAATLASVSHVLADIVAGAQLHPGWPFLRGVVPAPLVAMGDPWTVTLLTGTLLALWHWRQRQRTIARLAVVVVLLFLSAKAALLVTTLTRFPTGGLPGHVGTAIVEARWASLSGWHVFDRSRHSVRQWRFDAFEGAPVLVLEHEVKEESRLEARSRALDAVNNFLRVHELSFATERATAPGRLQVLWSDVRYCGPDLSHAGGIECGLWVGGEFTTRSGEWVQQQVQLGSWVQSRPTGPSWIPLP